MSNSLNGGEGEGPTGAGAVRIDGGGLAPGGAPGGQDRQPAPRGRRVRRGPSGAGHRDDGGPASGGAGGPAHVLLLVIATPFLVDPEVLAKAAMAHFISRFHSLDDLMEELTAAVRTMQEDRFDVDYPEDIFVLVDNAMLYQEEVERQMSRARSPSYIE
ncbi:hypothetical protein QR680_007662 [Steinernema hermaphroditum]|uniref:Uncharacterized protein n=1 Tax=Steinernema hermaphroditum TaxID=289476 RepID=A0AA39M6S2_9BILA|nr:hypothetical protein QR680_007662 [Steinernema hermaphroditum]